MANNTIQQRAQKHHIPTDHSGAYNTKGETPT